MNNSKIENKKNQLNHREMTLDNPNILNDVLLSNSYTYNTVNTPLTPVITKMVSHIGKIVFAKALNVFKCCQTLSVAYGELIRL